MKGRILIAAVAAAVLTGCISIKSYVDPSFARTRYEDLVKPAQALPLWVNVEFSRQGRRIPRADSEDRGHVERVLRASGLVTPQESAANGEITIAVNNVADLGEAAAKGFGTGLTFGLAGSTVQDGYEMTVTLARNGQTVTKSGYRHVVISTVGNKKGPEGLAPTTPGGAFGTVVEQMLLNALADLQNDGVLAEHDAPPAVSWLLAALGWR